MSELKINKALKLTKLKELKEEYGSAIYAGNGLYICYIQGIGWDLYSNEEYINTFLDFQDLIDAYKLIIQGDNNE